MNLETVKNEGRERRGLQLLENRYRDLENKREAPAK
jgi:hypothetical protein